MAQRSGLTLRQHQREEIGLRVEFVVAPEHRAQVRFSPASNAPDPHITTGTAMDVSTGGMGIVCHHFVPRMCEGTVRVYGPDPVGTAHDGTPVHEITFEQRCKVRRVILHSHDPSYSLGLAFLDPDPEMKRRVDALLKLVEHAQGRARADG